MKFIGFFDIRSQNFASEFDQIQQNFEIAMNCRSYSLFWSSIVAASCEFAIAILCTQYA